MLQSKQGIEPLVILLAEQYGLDCGKEGRTLQGVGAGGKLEETPHTRMLKWMYVTASTKRSSSAGLGFYRRASSGDTSHPARRVKEMRE